MRDDCGDLRGLVDVAIADLRSHVDDLMVVCELLPRTSRVGRQLASQIVISTDLIEALANELVEPDPDTITVLVRELVAIRQTTESIATYMISRELAELVGRELTRLRRSAGGEVEDDSCDQEPDLEVASHDAAVAVVVPMEPITTPLDGVSFLRARLAATQQTLAATS